MLTSLASSDFFALLQIGAAIERVADRGVEVDGDRLERRQVGRLDADRPEVRHRRVVDQRAQRVFRRCDLRLGDDHRLLALRHLGFGFDDVDRGRGADLDARPRVAQRLLRQLQRLPLHLQRGDRVREVPVGVAHRPRRSWPASVAAATSAISRFFWLTCTCCRTLSILKSRSSGCVIAERQRRPQLRLEVAEEVVVVERAPSQPTA